MPNFDGDSTSYVVDDSHARFFESAAEYRAWLLEHHDNETELWIGFYKKGSGRPGMTYSEAVDQSMCFGWIDGRVQRRDDTTYRQRYIPRTKRSTWSEVNIKKVERLVAEGLMHPSGIAAFEARTQERSGIYAYEQRGQGTLSSEQEARFKTHEEAWAFFESQPAWYRRTAIWIVTSAKRESTRSRRLEALIAASAKRERLERLTPPSGSDQ